MHVIILWTTNDFQFMGISNDETPHRKLMNKICYMYHHYFLPQGPVWRWSRLFHGKPKNRPTPEELFGIDLVQQLETAKDINLESIQGIMKGKTLAWLN